MIKNMVLRSHLEQWLIPYFEEDCTILKIDEIWINRTDFRKRSWCKIEEIVKVHFFRYSKIFASLRLFQTMAIFTSVFLALKQILKYFCCSFTSYTKNYSWKMKIGRTGKFFSWSFKYHQSDKSLKI